MKKAKGKKPVRTATIKHQSSTVRLSEEDAKEISRNFSYWLEIIRRLADEGDPKALGMLIGTATETTQDLHNIAERDPELLHPHSKMSELWPAMIGKHAAIRERNDLLIGRLKLSKEGLSNSRFQLTSKATETARAILESLHEYQKKLNLPPLSKATRDEWFKMGWRMWCIEKESDPNNYNLLRAVVIGAAESEWDRRGHNEKGEKRSKDNSAFENIVLQRIKSAVKQGFNSITNQLLVKGV